MLRACRVVASQHRGTLTLLRSPLRPPWSGEGISMHLDIESKHMTLVPHLMGWIAERLKDLNTPYDDICEAHITFIRQRRRDAVCIDLLLTGKSLHITQHGATPDA